MHGRQIAANGPNEFYEGATAKRFADEMAKHGGLISLSDLKNYKAVERKPMEGTYNGYTVITAPSSSSGGIALLEMLGILEGTGYEEAGAARRERIADARVIRDDGRQQRDEASGDDRFEIAKQSRCLGRVG